MTTRSFIKPLELLMLTLGSAIMFPYTFLPILTTYPNNRDVWIAAIIAVFLIIIFNLPLLYFVKKFRGLTLNQVFESISGKIFGKFFAILYVLFFIMCFFACMLLSTQFVHSSLMIKTPMWALVLLALVPATYAAIKGPGVVARISVFIVPPIFITVILFALTGAEFFDINVLKPILADSYFLDIIKGAAFTALRYSEIMIIFIFSYFLKQGASPIKVYFLNILLFGIFFLMILLPVLLTFGYTIASRSFNPYHLYARQVQLFDMIEKVQSLNTIVWFPGSLLKLSIYNCMASFILSEMFTKVKASIFSIALSILVFILSLIPAFDTTMFIGDLMSDQVMPLIILSLVVVIPIILLIIYFLTKKKVDAKMEKLRNDIENEKTEEEKTKHAMPNNDPVKS